MVPTLQPGDIVILDSLGSHKAPGIRTAPSVLPEQGSDFCRPIAQTTPSIEQVFAKLKYLLRKAATRSKETLWRKIGDLLAQFTPQECANYLTNSGYDSVKP